MIRSAIKAQEGGPRPHFFESVYSITIDWSYLEGMWGEVLVTMRLDFGTECRFEDEEVRKIMKLPEGQEVVIEGDTATEALVGHSSAIARSYIGRVTGILLKKPDAMLKL